MADTQMERPDDQGADDSARAARWLKELQVASKHEKKWRERAREVVERYRDEGRETGAKSQFNILWSNTETLKPAMYSSTPKPDVRRRYRDEDEVGREVARVLERGLAFMVDNSDFDNTMEAVVEDVLLPGRGIARERYIPTMAKGEPPRIEVEAIPILDPETGTETDRQFLSDGEPVKDPDSVQSDEMGFFLLGEPADEVVWEEVRTEYVLWENYRQSTEPLWRDKRWIAFGTEMTRDDLVSTFGDVGNEVQLVDTKLNEDDTEDGDDEGKFLKTAFVWEVWDKETKRVVFITEGYKEGPLLEIDDPLNLQGFFPTPEPLVEVSTNDTSVPIPEFTLYQDLANELDEVTNRLAKLVNAAKVRGLYDSQFSNAFAELFNADENELIPVDGFSVLAEKGGAEGSILWAPLEQITKAITGLYAERVRIVNAIYEITGISDIMRGATDPRETAKAQELKGEFGSLRIKPRQQSVQRYVRDLFRIKAEVMAEIFEPETLTDMTGIEVTPDMLALMRDDAMRAYRVDIETDSTVAADEQRDKQDVTELFGAMGEFIGAIGPLVQEGAMPQAAAVSILKWGMRKFKVSREIEDMLDAAEQAGGQGGEQQQDPEAQAKAQALMQETQLKQQEVQAEAQRKQQAQQAELELKQFEARAEQARKDREMEVRIRLMEEEHQREQARKDRLNQARVNEQREASDAER